MRVLAWILLGLLVGCGNQPETSTESRADDNDVPSVQAPVVPDFTVVCFGDSLTAGYGVDDADAWPAVLERQLLAAGYAVRVVNAGVSGDTSDGGVRRVPWILKADPDLVILCLGANDGLRGTDPAHTRENLRTMLVALVDADCSVVLAGMQLPTNLGPEYTQDFAAIYPALAEEFSLPIIPFLLEGVAAVPRLNQSDGIHPNRRGHAVVAKHVGEAIAPLLPEPEVVP